MTSDTPDVEIQWLAVYISEAHADDEWPVASARYNCGKEVHVNQTLTLSDRIVRAQSFFDNFSYTEDNRKNFKNWRLLVALPDEDPEAKKLGEIGFEEMYKPWPFRAYGLIDGKLDLMPEPHACELRIHEITNWLHVNLHDSW